MNQAAEFAENLVQRSSSSDIMLNKEALRQRFQELRGVEVPKHHQTTFAKFNAASQQDLKLGFIQLAAKSTVEGLDQTFQAGVEAEFTLCPHTTEGEINNQADLNDQVDNNNLITFLFVTISITEFSNFLWTVALQEKLPFLYKVHFEL